MKDIGVFLEKRYGLSVEGMHLLEGYKDKTFRIDSPEGRIVLKTHARKPGIAHRLNLENELTQALAKSLPYDFP
ncbi:hypothetical protein, partial [Robiginitalea sp.]|uniref:hypothetical protein n=1 Tax=Robiginitalea sp. TaxID=1902411 RepID=UPI003C780E2D